MAATDRAVNGLLCLKQIRWPQAQEAAAAFGVLLLDDGLDDPEGLEESDFDESDFDESDFDESDFDESDFDESDFEESDFGASFDASVFDSELVLAAASEEPFFDPDDAERLSFL
jgi:uncharacterized protein YjbI with pentapeptide repeats